MASSKGLCGQWTLVRNGAQWLAYWQRSAHPEVQIQKFRGGYSFRYTRFSPRFDGKLHAGFPSIKAICERVAA